MIYSPNPPFAILKDDEARWNWRWLLHGDEANIHLDNALMKHFNSAQAEIVSGTPAEALEMLRTLLPDTVTEAVQARAIEAQARLFPPLIRDRADNVVYVNFRKRA